MQRFTISLDDDLASAFDAWMASRAYANRSEAVRDLLRAELQSADLRDGRAAHCVASLSYVYNHHERELAERLTGLQHAHHELAVSTMHVHLDHDHCLETVVLRGPTARVRAFADALCAERGVHHGHLNLIGADLHGPHRHAGDLAHGHHHGPGDAHEPLHLHLKPSR